MESEMSDQKSYKPKDKEQRRLQLALARFRKTDEYQKLPEEFKKHF